MPAVSVISASLEARCRCQSFTVRKEPEAIESSVGIGIGLIFLAREGISYAFLKQMPEAEEAQEEAEATARAGAGPASPATPTT